MGLWTAKGGLPKVTAGTGINPVNSVSYNNTDPGTSPNQPVGALLAVSLGTSTSGQYDSDSFTYDPNTGRPTKYTFSVGNPAQTDVGQLTWNANGSLYQLQTTDNTSGSIDTQTCYYTHDDLGRIASVNCANGPTNVWQQNFSYDPFGNITKTGSLNFQPSYSTNPPTNRITSAGYTYDNNGNLTADATGNHQYSWDAEGRPTCIDNVVQSYDAMGRLVEQARGGTCASPGTTYQQIVFGPGGGKLALMTVQTLTKAFVPLPGGETAVYTSTGLTYYRHSDWLGSSRLATTPARAPYYTGAYAPFGENYKENGTTDRSFTDENQDTVGGAAPLYDFMFREHTPNQGRWISPDPAGLAAVSLTDPQSWNRYAYLSNTPLTNVDPLGLAGGSPIECLDDSPCPHGIFDFDSTAGFSLSGWNEFDLMQIPVYDVGFHPLYSGETGRPLFGVWGKFQTFNFFGMHPGELSGSGGGQDCEDLVGITDPDIEFTVLPNVQLDLNKQFAEKLTAAFRWLNLQGITPEITSAYRTAQDQLRMRQGGSGSNPAAVVSYHEAGLAVDLNHTTSLDFVSVIQAMEQQGLAWGGNFRKPDPPHFDGRRFGGSPRIVKRCGIDWHSRRLMMRTQTKLFSLVFVLCSTVIQCRSASSHFTDFARSCGVVPVAASARVFSDND